MHLTPIASGLKRLPGGTSLGLCLVCISVVGCVWTGESTMPSNSSGRGERVAVHLTHHQEAEVLPVSGVILLASSSSPDESSDREKVDESASQKPPELLSPPSVITDDSRNTLDLAAALRFAGVDNPTINLAQERIREALAAQLAARSLLLPSINVGTNFRLHRGALQDDPGFLIEPGSQGLFLGAGAGAVGTGTVVIPGVWLFSYLSDAVYAPAEARQRVSADTADAQAVQNAILGSVSTAYLQLVAAGARLEILRRAHADVEEIVRITSAFAKSGAGSRADAERSLGNANLVLLQIRAAEAEIVATSARLSALLSQDPSGVIHTPGGIIEAFRLVKEDADLESLLAVAIRARPELIARAAEIDEAQIRVRHERVRPWLPLLAVGYSAGLFGGGSNLVATEFGPLESRADFGVLAAWNIQNMGVGNHALVSRARAVLGQATANYQTTLNLVRDEVARAQAGARTAAKQIQVAKTAMSDAEEGFRLDANRIRAGQGLPIEALDSFRQLMEARLELLRATIAFDISQFQLWVAMGANPASARPEKVD